MALLSFIHAKTESWADTAAEILSNHLSEALERANLASLVVPGGRSAQAVLPKLALSPLNWRNVSVILSDERWVPTHHPDSNELLVREKLIHPTGAHMIGLKSFHNILDVEAVRYCASIVDQIPRPIDVVLIGMGEDGHTASIFPGMHIGKELIQNVKRPDYDRITLTPRILLNSRHIILPVIGPSKIASFERALEPGTATDLPIRHIIHQERVPVTVIIA